MSTMLCPPSVPVESAETDLAPVSPVIPPKRSGFVNIFIRIENHRSCKFYYLRKILGGFRLTEACEDDPVSYRVTIENGFRSCTCPDFAKRFGTGLESPCKHILALAALSREDIITFDDDYIPEYEPSLGDAQVPF